MTVQRSTVSSKLKFMFQAPPELTGWFSDSSNQTPESEGNDVNGTFEFGSQYVHIAASSILPLQEFIFKKVTRLLWEGKEQCLFIYLFSQYLLTLYSVPDTILGTGDALMKRTE